MRASSFLFTILFLMTQTSTAGTTSVSSGNETSPAYFKLSGCGILRNLTNNIAGYTVKPELSREHSINICGEFYNEGSSLLEVFEEMAKLAKNANCFEAKIDKAKKTITLEFLPNLLAISFDSITTENYSYQGQLVFSEKREKNRQINLCILDPVSVEPPYDAALKKIEQ